jgi:phosphate starvation-inducible protein PhoH
MSMGKAARKHLKLLDNDIIYEEDFNTRPHRLTGNQSKAFKMKTCVPITQTQQETFEAFDKGDNLLLHGLAGTGKTFISMYLALREVLEGHNHKQVIVIRSVVPTRDIGFLPGNAKEKSKIYEGPYYAICNELFGRGDAYDILKSKNTIDFMTTSFLRGTTLNNAIIIVDEVNNMTLHELDSVITRLGKNCRIVFCGDFRQSDLLKESERRGLMEFMTILQNMRSFSHIEFTQEDIVRSGLVKQYIITKDRLGIHT